MFVAFVSKASRLTSGLEPHQRYYPKPQRGECIWSQRDSMIVAWHEVPGESVHRESRPVGYGMIESRYARLRESDRAATGRPFGRRCPRHFVPGYDRIVPMGQESHSPQPGPRFKLVLWGWNSGLSSPGPSGQRPNSTYLSVRKMSKLQDKARRLTVRRSAIPH